MKKRLRLTQRTSTEPSMVAGPARARKRATRMSLLVPGIMVIAFTAAPASATTAGPNGLIAFSADTTSGTQLFTVHPDGTHRRQITHVAGFAGNVDWSPDGRRIAFTVGTETSSQVAVARADGSQLRLLPQPAGVLDDQPSFTPDGRRLYFERLTVATNDDAIWTMSSDGRGQRRVLGPFPKGYVTDPNISPDGRTMSFQGSDGSLVGPPPDKEMPAGLFTSTPSGAHITQIRPFSSDQTIKADWAPDGRRIAVTENANFFHSGDSANIVTMRPDGSGVRHLTTFHDGVTNAFFGSYSPDGRWVVFRLEQRGLFGLYRMHPDGSHRQVILPLSPVRPFLIDWGSHDADK